MSSTFTSGNGCSLEDCHTNLFALTDLAGIKWRKLETADNYVYQDALEDPVLRSWTRCIQNNILCVWRRSQQSTDQRIHDKLTTNKELWLFWYGSEPPNMNSLIAPELQSNASEGETGSWDGGLTYECRTLLFKALHNLIERCLIQQSFVRVGKWFVQPYDNGKTPPISDRSGHLSIKFSFFLHGESQVCASIDVRQHTPLRRLLPQHLAVAHNHPNTVQVILAPYGLAGVLTGHVYKASDYDIHRMLEEWRQFYILKDPVLNSDGECVPPVVEVIVGTTRMRYPSSYVLLTADTESEILQLQPHPSAVPNIHLAGVHHQTNLPPGHMHNDHEQAIHHECHTGQNPGHGNHTNPTMLADAQDSRGNSQGIAESSSFISLCNGIVDPPIGLTTNKELAQLLLEQVHEDCIIGTHLNHPRHGSHHHAGTGTHSEHTHTEESTSWNFIDASQKQSCGCTKQRTGRHKYSKHGANIKQEHIKSEHGLSQKMNSDNTSSATGQSSSHVAFHRRSVVTDLQIIDVDHELMHVGHSNQSVGGLHNQDGLFGVSKPQSVPGNHGDSNHDTASPALIKSEYDDTSALESPRSAVPSLLLAESTVNNQQATDATTDATMPTLSPHPPNINGGSSTPGTADEIKRETGVEPLPNGDAPGIQVDDKTSASSESVKHNGHLCGANAALNHTGAAPGLNGPPQIRPGPGNLWLQNQKDLDLSRLKRPALPTTNYGDDKENEMKTLYDTQSLSRWLEFPVKRHRGDAQSDMICSINTEASPGMNGYGGRGDLDASSNLNEGYSMGQKQSDPYEFSEESSSNADSFTKRRALRSSRDDSFPKQSPFIKQEDEGRNGSDSAFNFDVEEESTAMDESPSTKEGVGGQLDLMRKEGLVPTINDLDKLFETDSESDADMGFSEVSTVGDAKANVDYSEPSQKDLSVMYPTPPSMENHHQDMDLDGSATMVPRADMGNGSCKMEHDVKANVEDIKDWSYVYRPPITSTFVSCDKYAPIELASSRLAPITLASNPNINPQMLVYPLPAQNAGEMFIGLNMGGGKPSHPLHTSHPQHTQPQTHHVPSPSIPPSNNHLSAPSLGPTLGHQLQTNPHYANIPSVEAPGSVSSQRQPGTPRSIMDASPSPYTPQAPNSQPPHGQQRTPMGPGSNYPELQSPMSNSSSTYPHMKSVGGSVTGGHHGHHVHLPEVNPVVVNTMLADSLLNLFKDHNFDSCTICACNMNIKGFDVGVYLADNSSESQYRCVCGFSAVMNRRYGANSGLFYEDEVDITGLPHDQLDHRKPPLAISSATNKTNSEAPPAGTAPIEKPEPPSLPQGEVIPHDVMALLQEQFSTFYPSSVVLYYYYHKQLDIAQQRRLPIPNVLDFHDGCEASFFALDVGRQQLESYNQTQRSEELLQKTACLHNWPYLQDTAQVPTNAQDVVRFLKALQPLLQDTIHKKRTTTFWQSVYTVSGPLTWKDFHLLAGRGSHESSEPQPIPPLLVSHDAEWLTLAPHALRYWDKLLLEPYGHHRNIAYVVVAPDNDVLISSLRVFFRHLSCAYEQCRLGRHIVVSNKIRDGIVRVSKALTDKMAEKLNDTKVDDWFTNIGTEAVASKLKLYAQTCRHKLGPLLTAYPVDRSMFKPPPKVKTRHAPSPAPSPAPPTPDNPGSVPPAASPNPGSQQSDDKDASDSAGNSSRADLSEDHPDTDGSAAPAIVVYLIEPFTYGDHWQDHSRLATLGLLRSFNEMQATLPPNIQAQVHLQIIPLQTILDFSKRPDSQILKTLAMSVYTECRTQVSHTIAAKSLTGFGPVATAADFTKADKPGALLSTRILAPPFILAPEKTRTAQDVMMNPTLNLWHGDRNAQSSTLLCAYCLSSDQRWLVASCTDASGAVLETCTINIEVPNRNRRKKASARKIGLAKLWDFILRVVGRTTLPWRLIIGRFGRLGHGELKGWVCLLSKRNLVMSNKQLRTSCELCSALPNADIPCIVSACVVSLESHPTVHILHDIVKEEERQSSQCPLNTPREASTSHILVFPTSTTAQAPMAQNAQDQGGAGGMDLADNLDDDIDFDTVMGDIGGEMDMWDLIPGSPNASPKGGDAGGSGMGGIDIDMKTSGGDLGSSGQAHNAQHQALAMVDLQNDDATSLQQPLAMGYYLSTAPCGPLPQWFWSANGHREGLNPSCLKAALHVHTHCDEFSIPVQKGSSGHPLDSNFTCDVLRYVLETYHNLSWLTIDPATNDRRSCLPVHIVALLQLYHALDLFV